MTKKCQIALLNGTAGISNCKKEYKNSKFAQVCTYKHTHTSCLCNTGFKSVSFYLIEDKKPNALCTDFSQIVFQCLQNPQTPVSRSPHLLNIYCIKCKAVFTSLSNTCQVTQLTEIQSKDCIKQDFSKSFREKTSSIPGGAGKRGKCIQIIKYTKRKYCCSHN